MATKSTINGKAVQIADVKDNRLYIDMTAFNKIMDKVGEAPLSVVSVNGPLRSGKSYMLSYFIKYLSSSESDDWFKKEIKEKFHWKNSADRQTTGILMWSEPFFIIRENKMIAILLMDTQGCFDERTTGQENSAIFALSCLLSSVLIFNVKNLISEDIYQNLQMFIGYAGITKDSEQSDRDIDHWNKSSSQDSESFSKLVFLVRDWQCPMDYKFGYYDNETSSGTKNFKKEKVDLKYDMVSEARVVRKAILESFENVGCCLMPYPGNELAFYDFEGNLEPEFIKTIKDFVPRIFSAENICIKKIGDDEITGDDFKLIVQRWAKCFERCDFPGVSTVAEASAKFQNQKALSIAIKIYRQNMSNDVEMNDGLSDEQIDDVHMRNRGEAIAAFKRIKRINLDEIENQYMKKLVNLIQEAYETYQKMNYVKRMAIESGTRSEAETNQLKQGIEKMSKQLEKSQDFSTSVMNVHSQQYTVRFINKTKANITIYWKNHHFWNEEKYEVKPDVTKIFSFYGYDNIIWSTLYRAKITQFEENEAKFWAFGNGAPRLNNIFTVKSDGIYLGEDKHEIWGPIEKEVVNSGFVPNYVPYPAQYGTIIEELIKSFQLLKH